MATPCETCHSYKIFGKKCWFFWEDKKECSQYRETPHEEPHFKNAF